MRSAIPGIHGGSTREHDVAVEILTDINVALHDGVVGGLVDPTASIPRKMAGRGPRGTETLVTDGDDLTVRKLVGLLEGGGRAAVCISCSKSRAT